MALEPSLNHLNWAWAVFINPYWMCCCFSWINIVLVNITICCYRGDLVSSHTPYTYSAPYRRDPQETLSLPTHHTPILHLTGGIHWRPCLSPHTLHLTGGIHRRPCLSPHTIHLFCTLQEGSTGDLVSPHTPLHLFCTSQEGSTGDLVSPHTSYTYSAPYRRDLQETLSLPTHP
jgi:hypothetical protein